MGHYEQHQRSQMVEKAIAPHEAAVLAAWRAKAGEVVAPVAVDQEVMISEGDTITQVA